MTPTTDPDLKVVVVEAFQRYLGTVEDLPLASLLLEDIGVDSLTFVTILLELADTLRLDVFAAEVSLSEVRRIEDVVALLQTLSVEKRRALCNRPGSPVVF